MKIIDKILELIEKIASALAALLLIAMLFALSVQVISRTIFNTGFAWTEESARYMMVIMVFIGAIVCTKQGIHVAVDALEEFLPKLTPVLKIIQTIIFLVYCGVILKFGLEILPTAAVQTSPNMKIPMSYIYVVFPIVTVFIAIYSIRHLIGVFRKENYGVVKDEVTEALEAVEEECNK